MLRIKIDTSGSTATHDRISDCDSVEIAALQLLEEFSDRDLIIRFAVSDYEAITTVMDLVASSNRFG